MDDFNVVLRDEVVGTFRWSPVLERGRVGRVAQVVYAETGATAIMPNEQAAERWFEAQANPPEVRNVP